MKKSNNNGASSLVNGINKMEFGLLVRIRSNGFFIFQFYKGPNYISHIESNALGKEILCSGRTMCNWRYGRGIESDRFQILKKQNTMQNTEKR